MSRPGFFPAPRNGATASKHSLPDIDSHQIPAFRVARNETPKVPVRSCDGREGTPGSSRAPFDFHAPQKGTARGPSGSQLRRAVLKRFRAGVHPGRSHFLRGTIAAVIVSWLLAASTTHTAEPVVGEADKSPLPLSTIGRMRSLSKAEAQRGLRIKVRGVVTYYDPKWDTLFIQDETAGTYVYPTQRLRPRYEPGQMLEVEGRTVAGAVANSLIEERITVAGTAPLPAPIPVSFSQMGNGRLDSQWVEINGVVRGITTEWQRMEIDLAVNGGRFRVHLPRPPGQPLPIELMHARVRVRGVCGTIFNPQEEVAGVRMFTPGPGYFTVTAPPVTNAFQLPLTPLTNFIAGDPLQSSPTRIRTSGSVTLRWPSGKIFVQDDATGLEIELAKPWKMIDPEGVTFPNPEPVQFGVGDRIEAVGYPSIRGSRPLLEEAELHKMNGTIPLQPTKFNPAVDAGTGATARLVEMEARLEDELPYDPAQPGIHRYLLHSGEINIEALLESDGFTGLALLPGSRMRLTGVYVPTEEVSGRSPKNVRLFLRGPADVAVLAGPPFWTRQETLRVVGGAAVVLTALLAWMLFLWYQGRQKSILNLQLERSIRSRTGELVAANEQLQREVAERSRAQAALQESQASIRTIVEHNPEAIVVFDMDAGKFIEANDNAARLFGMPREELLQRGPVDFSPPMQPDGTPSEAGAREQLQAALDGGNPVFEWIHRNASGKEFPCEVRLARLPAENRRLVVGTLADIAARKQAEQDLLRSLVLEKELGELKSNFVSMVSHEFRTPLGIIMSSAEILDRYLDRLPPESRREHLDAINGSVRRMSRLMEEVLLLSKVEAGQMSCTPAATDLTDYCRRLVDETLSATNHLCPIRLSAENLPATLLADEKLLRHIFTNLLSNAVKYSPAGSPVDFRVRGGGESIVFQVEDRGLGIPAADQPRMFKAFHRGNNVTHLAGTGLGLTIVKRCVDLHGGNIEFESVEGAGATFTVTLPLGPESPPIT